MATDAENWDTGSQNDHVRNDFIIPNLAAILNQYKPQSILDVGAATGYVARKVDGKLNYRPKWTLLEQNSERLKFAFEKKPTAMIADPVESSFLETAKPIIKYEALVISFTLLELGMSDDVFRRIRESCSTSGIVVIALPDVWGDVLVASQSDTLIAERFLTKSVTIQKIDKFTSTEYPFIAQRLELLIYSILELGFILELFKKNDFDTGTVYLLAFKSR